MFGTEGKEPEVPLDRSVTPGFGEIEERRFAPEPKFVTEQFDSASMSGLSEGSIDEGTAFAAQDRNTNKRNRPIKNQVPQFFDDTVSEKSVEMR